MSESGSETSGEFSLPSLRIAVSARLAVRALFLPEAQQESTQWSLKAARIVDASYNQDLKATNFDAYLQAETIIWALRKSGNLAAAGALQKGCGLAYKALQLQFGEGNVPIYTKDIGKKRGVWFPGYLEEDGAPTADNIKGVLTSGIEEYRRDEVLRALAQDYLSADPREQEQQTYLNTGAGYIKYLVGLADQENAFSTLTDLVKDHGDELAGAINAEGMAAIDDLLRRASEE